MVTEKLPMQGCPVQSCESAVDLAIVTTEGTKLTTQNLTHARTCLHPTEHKGEPAVIIVYHREIDPVAPEPVTDDEEPDGEPDDDGTDTPDPADLSGDLKTVYKHIAHTSGSIQLGQLKGKCLDNDIAPDAVESLALTLAERGYVEQVTDGVYKAT